MRRSAVAGG